MSYHMRKLNVGVPLLRIDEPNVVVQHRVNQDQLNLIGGEEPSRAGVAPVPKAQAILAHAHKLVQC